MTFRKKILISLFVSVFLAAFSLAGVQEKAAQIQVQTATLDQTLPVDSQITLGKFDNGLRYYIRVNKKPENRAELRLVVNAGSVLEDDDQRGLAHFVEHMSFNGT